MWKSTIVREITWVLLVKLSALWLIWFAFFHQPDRQAPGSDEVGQRLLGELRPEQEVLFINRDKH